jgi:hypothetical protein
MILPSKHLSTGRSLLGVGGEILTQLDRPREVSDLWERFRAARVYREKHAPITFDWFVLALTFLFALKAIHFDGSALAPGSGEA